MPLTKDFKDTIKARAECDPKFRVGFFREAIEALISDDLATGKVLLRDYVIATVGFEALAQDMDKDPNAHAQREGVSFSLTPNSELHV